MYGALIGILLDSLIVCDVGDHSIEGGVVQPVVFRAAAKSSARESHPVGAADQTWSDARRGRSVPVKIYYPASGEGPFPVIVFSHGLGGSRDGCAYLGRYWAGRGYVSVHVQHVGSDESVWRGKLRPLRALRESFEDPANSLQRVGDVRFAIDRLEEINGGDSFLGGRLDLDRVGVAGHAFGAQTALAVAGQELPGLAHEPERLADPRVKAVLSMSAPVPFNAGSLEEVYAQIHVPCLHMTGTEDDSPVGATRAQHRRLPFDYCNDSDQFLITFAGADHMTFPGHRRRRPSRSDPQFHRLIQQSSARFWDAYLKDDPAAKAWLVEGGLRSTLAGAGRLEAKIVCVLCPTD